jgi:hypothetical protein
MAHIRATQHNIKKGEQRPKSRDVFKEKITACAAILSKMKGSSN